MPKDGVNYTKKRSFLTRVSPPHCLLKSTASINFRPLNFFLISLIASRSGDLRATSV